MQRKKGKPHWTWSER